MKFGIILDSNINRWDLIRYAEELGFHRAWAGDSQMIWSDCYALLALAAANTKRILIGTGVAIPGTRIAPVTAHSIATINQIAPGRVFLGVGTGHTAMRVMGQDPMPIREFREYLRVLRALLDGAAVDYRYRGKTREIQFLHRDRYFINLDQRIPIYVAANGPKALETTGEYSDGWITAGGGSAEEIGRGLEKIRLGASKVRRTLPRDFLAVGGMGACVLRRGEKLTDDRVINETGSIVTTLLHFAYEIWDQLGRQDQFIPPFFADSWAAYVKRVQGFSLPENARFRQIHDGHATFLQPEERRFVTPEAIRATCLAGEPDEILERLRILEHAGLQEVALIAPADYQGKVFRDIAEFIIPSFR
jgi:alkanesulfonate monooxygenase SsuD/methylene tetrahydromethanopterin reductase-like flavin-dependent oxidoreductase (luciferase family)